MVTRIGSSDPDTLTGSTDDDSLRGKAGDDVLWGLAGHDILEGDSGNDVLHAGPGLDSLYGGSDDDRLEFQDLSGGQAFGGTGLDTLVLTLSTGPSLYLDFRDGTATQSGTVPGTLAFSGVERLVLTSAGDGDTVFGSGGNDVVIFGGRGAEAHGRGGDDLVSYIPSLAAILDGGDGNDTLQVDAGSNVLYFIVDTFAGSVDDGQLSQINGFETYHVTGGSLDDISSFDIGNDTFFGRDGDDTSFGGLGDDSLSGGRQNDSLVGAEGNDWLFGSGQDDILDGGDGDDRLLGGRGQDVIDGGAGRDRIMLYLGNDTVTGGADADRFIFNRNESSVHTLTDFTSGSDRLLIDDRLLQFGPGPGDLDPSRLSYGSASGPQAQFVLVYDAGSDRSSLLWDPNGNMPAGGNYILARFEGQVVLTAFDITIL